MYLDIDIYIIKSQRAMGIAVKALKFCIDQLDKVPLRRTVKKSNITSFKFFEKCGFLCSSENNLQWVLVKY